MAEFLLGQEANVGTIASVVKRDDRTVYRALNALKRDPAFRVMRVGQHGEYSYRVERV